MPVEETPGSTVERIRALAKRDEMEQQGIPDWGVEELEEVRKRRGYTGPARFPAPAQQPVRASMTDPRGITTSVQKALSQGIGADGVNRPAADVNELQAQIAAVIAAFEAAEGRLPTPRDAEFWKAYAELVKEFTSR